VHGDIKDIVKATCDVLSGKGYSLDKKCPQTKIEDQKGPYMRKRAGSRVRIGTCTRSQIGK